jgi:hypothetical protein
MRATSSIQTLPANRKMTRPTTRVAVAASRTGLRPTASEIVPETRTAPSAATAYTAKTTVVISGVRCHSDW